MERPNIIFILADDLGWRDLACYKSNFYESPNIDRLYEESIVFDNAYAASPICSPTRASILTGKYPARVGVTNFIAGNKANHPAKGKLIDAPYIDHLPLDEICLAKPLSKAGYDTWHVGKWHLGTSEYYPEKHGFQINIAGCHKGMPSDGYFSPWNIENLEEKVDGEYLTDRLTDEAIQLIKNKGDNPYFLHMAYYSVHTPIQAKEEYVNKFKEKAKAMGLDKLKVFEEGEFYPTERKKEMRIKRRMIQSDPVYAAMIYSLDENIGRLLEAVKESGEEDNTIIFFTSDNGGLSSAEGSPTCNAPLNEGKGWMAEGGIREPLIVKWKDKINSHAVCHEPVISTDFYPTILDMAGIALMPDQHMDGENLVPLLNQSANELNRDALYWHYPHYGNNGGTPGSIIRDGDYKLIEFFEDNRLELYNLKDDIGEQNNLVGKEQQKAKELHQRLKEWRDRLRVEYPTING